MLGTSNACLKIGYLLGAEAEGMNDTEIHRSAQLPKNAQVLHAYCSISKSLR